MITKVTPAVDFIDGVVSWDREVSIRCCVGWTVDISVLVVAPNGATSASAPLITIGESSCDKAIDLHGLGSLHLNVDFFPNHLDMSCLTRDCILESFLPRLLLDELFSSTKSTSDSILQTENSFSNALISACQRLHNCLSKSLLRELLSKHLFDTIDRDDSTSIISEKGSPVFHRKIPDRIELHRALATAKQYFRYIMKDFKQVRCAIACKFRLNVIFSDKYCLLALYSWAVVAIGWEVVVNLRPHSFFHHRRLWLNHRRLIVLSRLRWLRYGVCAVVSSARGATRWPWQWIWNISSWAYRNLEEVIINLLYFDSHFDLIECMMLFLWNVRFQEYDAEFSGYIPAADLVLFLQVSMNLIYFVSSNYVWFICYLLGHGAGLYGGGSWTYS